MPRIVTSRTEQNRHHEPHISAVMCEAFCGGSPLSVTGLVGFANGDAGAVGLWVGIVVVC